MWLLLGRGARRQLLQVLWWFCSVQGGCSAHACGCGDLAGEGAVRSRLLQWGMLVCLEQHL